MNWEKILYNIREELASYIRQGSLKSLICGSSGGIDSSLCIALASPVCQKLSIPLISRFIMIESNKTEEIERGEKVGKAFCSDYAYADLSSLYRKTLLSVEEPVAFEETLSQKIRRGNIKARLRMVYLYNLAQQTGGLVLSTDNYTELLLGFWTLHGDVGDYGMIQALWKTEVYELAQWLVENELQGSQATALKDTIDAIPTDGLGITGSDLEQLKASSYAEVDKALQTYLNEGKILNEQVISRHLRSAYKRTNPYNISREILLK